jgi:hypothetical protein
MEVFYHICGNDLVRSIAYQSHTLILTTSNRPYRLEKSRIEALATADAPLIGSAIADLLLEQQSLLRCLVLEQMDPQFLEKWLSLEKAALTELFRTHRHSESRSRDMAEVFSISLVNGYLHGALENDRKAILRTHHTTTEIIRQLIK